MKKFISIILCLAALLSLAACGKANENLTMGQTLLQDFEDRVKADGAASPQTIVDGIVENPVLPFTVMTMEVQPGLLNGFGSTEIQGFSQGVMFSPMIGAIPFVGYVFRLAEGTDGDDFVKTLNDNADLRWNICTEADEKIVKQEGELVFFLMSPIEEEE